MAKSAPSNSNTMMTNESPLAQAEASRYVEQQKSADLNRNMAQYMFWGATSIMLGLGAAFFTAPASLTLALLLCGGAASAATFAGSVFFSRKATEISEQSNVLYSDVDSQNQARRMVQAFARAQSQDASPAQAEATPMAGGWADRVGGSAARSGSWQQRVVAQAEREDAIAMQNLRG